MSVVSFNQQETVAGEAPAEKDLSSDAAARGQGTTGYETLSVFETVKKFKMNAFICLLVAVSAAADGYQIGYKCPSRRTNSWC